MPIASPLLTLQPKPGQAPLGGGGLRPEPALPVDALHNAPAGVAADAALDVLDDEVEQRRFTRYRDRAEGGREAESSLRIFGMHCAACADDIEAAVARLPGIVEARVSAAGERARITWVPGQTSVAGIVRSIRAAGYDAAPDLALAARELRRQESRQALWRLFVAAFCAMQVMMLATPSYVSVGDELAPDIRQLLNWSSWLLTLPVLAFSAGPFFRGAWHSLRRRRIGMDVPVVLGITVTFIASTGATFEPGGVFGHEVYFDSLTMFVSFLLLGRMLETRARHRAAQTLEAALDGMPEMAERVLEGGRTETVSVQRLAPGDRLRVAVGQAFAADGVLVQGHTQADESLLTGESAAVDKPLGAAVVAGSLNLGAPVDLRIERVGEATRLAGIVALMQQAMTERPAWARAADRWAAPFLWTVLLLAAGAAAVWSVIDPSRAVWVAVSVLIVTCPCALSLAAPAALLSAAGGLAKRGVLVQRLDALEAMTRLDRLYLDKTGTVTDDQLQLAQVDVLAPDVLQAGLSPAAQQAQVLGWAAGLAAWSAHPASRALIRGERWQQQAQADTSIDAGARSDGPGNGCSGITAGAVPAWHSVSEVPGQGVRGSDAQGRRWRLGSRHWVTALEGAGALPDALPGALLDALPDEQPGADQAAGLPHQTVSSPAQALAGATATPAANAASTPEPIPEPTDRRLWLACEARPVAAFTLAESLRPDAAEAVAALQAEGLELVLLSGDRPDRTRALADRLGMAQALGGTTPEGKLAEVRQAQASGLTVGMVGDGVNDAPVLACADVSVAMGQAALVARAQADMVMVGGRLSGLLEARRMARRAMRVVRQNLAWAATYNAVCIPLALVGWLPPWAAGLGMALSSLLVVGNAARLSR